MENKCDCCDKEASYHLSNLTMAKCSHCDKIKYQKHDLTINLCDLRCKHFYGVLGRIIRRDPNDFRAKIVLEKDECVHCGEKDWPCITFSGIFVKGESSCEFCNDPARYTLVNVDHIVCCKCNTIIHSEEEYTIKLCSTKCVHSKWNVLEYLTEVGDKHTEVVYRVNGKCPYCHKIYTTDALFTGQYIGYVTVNNARIPKYSNAQCNKIKNKL